VSPARSTTERGYGYQHRKARTAALKALRDGDPCSRCGGPMFHGQQLDLDHTDDRSGYLGLAHAGPCNRSAGARKGNQQRGTRPRRSRIW